MGQPIDGRALAAEIRSRVRTRLAASRHVPGLAIVLVGDDPASHLYVRLKEEACAEVGIRFERHAFATATTEDLITVVRSLGNRTAINGILVQLPLPAPIDTDAVIAAISPAKDVDGFHPENLARLDRGTSKLVSGVARGILALIEAPHMSLDGARAAILANSAVFCRPIEHLLHNRGVRVHRCAPFQPGIHTTADTANADIIVSALGCGGCLDAPYVKAGAVLIDVGVTKTREGRIHGDFSRDAQERAGWFSPVPGGVGPMTIAMVLENVLIAASMHE